MADLPLAKLVDYKPLTLQKTHHNTYEKANPLVKEHTLVDEHALLGIEIELENLPIINHDFVYYWTMKEDNSLRNHGREFVSIPLRANQVEQALQYLNSILKNYDPQVSNRCSVHVHLNVRDFTVKQLIAFVAYYSIFEKHFFYFAGAKRESSIFCVPLYKTDPRYKLSELYTNLQFWHKYNALNLGTTIGSNQLPAYGTVEFRHLYGTTDPKIIINWINQILCLRKAALNADLNQVFEKIKVLNTTSEYTLLYQEIFGNYADFQKMTKHDFESCVSFVKRWEWGYDLNELVKKNQNSPAYAKLYKKNGKPLRVGFIKPSAFGPHTVTTEEGDITAELRPRTYATPYDLVRWEELNNFWIYRSNGPQKHFIAFHKTPDYGFPEIIPPTIKVNKPKTPVHWNTGTNTFTVTIADDNTIIGNGTIADAINQGVNLNNPEQPVPQNIEVLKQTVKKAVNKKKTTAKKKPFQNNEVW